MSKRQITSFFTPLPSTKKPRISLSTSLPPSSHPSYPFAIACLPQDLDFSSLNKPSRKAIDQGQGQDSSNNINDTNNNNNDTCSSSDGNIINKPPQDHGAGGEKIDPERRQIEPVLINDKPELDLLYYKPFLNASVSNELFGFLRRELPFYRVVYKIRKATEEEREVRTPRFTTVFGVDKTSYFHPHSGELLDSNSKLPIPKDRYATCKPRPVPQCLDILRRHVENRTGESYNFVLVNYYADGNDSISYHSDDERFLGEKPAIASLSLGSKRDFLMKHKSLPSQSLKLTLSPGDLLLMRGETQRNWLHSVPKRSGSSLAGGGGGGGGLGLGGRINITFRKAVGTGGTGNYYCYNVGQGGVWRWNEKVGKMVESCGDGGSEEK